jgi:uncharacterized protein (TIGR03382 family)
MKRLIAATFAMMLLPAVAVAGPKWTDGRTDVEMRMQGPSDSYSCNAGSPTTLLVGAAALGLVLRRRR